MVLENDIPEILRQSRDRQRVYFSFHVSVGYDQLMEGFRLVSDRAKVAERKLAFR